MINLLPTQEQKQINAGRANVILRRYCISSLLFIFLLAVTAGGFYFVLVQSKNTAQKDVDEGKQRIAEHQSIQGEINNFKNNLSTAKNIIGNEIHYSKIIPAIAKTIPAPMRLQSLQLQKDSFGDELSLTVYAFNEQDAVTLKSALEKETSMFQNVYLDSVQIGGGEANSQIGIPQNSRYTTTINIKVTLRPEVAKL